MSVPTAVAAVARRTPLSRELGRVLRERRVGEGLRQDDVAEFCSTSQPTVARWEAGLAVPDLATVLKLAARLGFSVDELGEVAA